MMQVVLIAPDGTQVQCRTSGRYSPDVMADLVNRALELAGAGMEFMRDDLDEAEASLGDDPDTPAA